MGEGPLFVPEKLALQQFLGDGAAVDGHERTVGTPAVGMQGPHKQLLACSRFTSYKNRAVRRSDLVQYLEDFHKARALTDDAVSVQLHEALPHNC